MEGLCVPAIYGSFEDASDLCDLSLSFDPDVLEEELRLLNRLELPRLFLQTLRDIFPLDVAGIPVEVSGEELFVASAADPQDGFGLLSRVFLSGEEEDVDNQVLVPAPAQVDSSSLHLLSSNRWVARF